MQAAVQILVVWMLVFLVALFPALWAGRWVARISPNTGLGLLLCVVMAKGIVAVSATILMGIRFDSLSHVNADRTFALFFTAVMLGIPLFSALVVGFLRARKQGMRPVQVSR